MHFQGCATLLKQNISFGGLKKGKVSTHNAKMRGQSQQLPQKITAMVFKL